MALWHVTDGRTSRWAVGGVEEGPDALLPESVTLAGLLNGDADFKTYTNAPTEPIPDSWWPVAPVDIQEVWAAGVTFIESRYAREEESSAPDFYRQVYFADRPELFLKAPPGSSVGSNSEVGIRADSEWNVPEAELALVVDANARIVALTIGDDVSSRSIEGENPLYLPQAKLYDLSCALGPCLVPVEDAPPIEELEMTIGIHRDGAQIFEGTGRLADLKRHPQDLVDWLFSARTFPAGVVLLCGTSVVPPVEFSMQPGDVVRIDVTALGTLVNTATRIGRRHAG